MMLVSTASVYAVEQAKPGDTPQSVPQRKMATPSVAGPSATDLLRVKGALLSYAVTAIVGESAILQAATSQQGLPEKMIVKTGRALSVAGVVVTATVSEAGVGFVSPASSTPFYVAMLNQGSTKADAPINAVAAVMPLSEPVVAAAQGAAPQPSQEARPSSSTTWTLTAGNTVGQELQAWGEKAGWKVIWNMPKDWSVPASTNFTGGFQAAASEVIKTLATNGALVRARFFEGNNTMIVTGPSGPTQ